MVHEVHRTQRASWLRAAVLGANDGIVSTASLLVGVAASGAGRDAILLTGVAGLVAGAMSMAAGEFVSVSSQSDSERADLERERHELDTDRDDESRELTAIYVSRGLTPALAREVAEHLMAHDALGAHARDELGFSQSTRARPVQAALASAGAFAIGATAPTLVAAVAPLSHLASVIAITSLSFLAILGALAAHAGGASRRVGIVRVVFWGALAMAATALVGRLFGAIVG